MKGARGHGDGSCINNAYYHVALDAVGACAFRWLLVPYEMCLNLLLPNLIQGSISLEVVQYEQQI